MMTSTICSSNKLGNWLTVRNSDVLQQIFPVHVISWNGDAEWLARSLYLSGDTSRGRYCPRTIDALKHSIKEETVTVWVEMTCTVMRRMHSKSTTVYTDGWKSSW
jgi:hypothetical protein